MSDMRFRTLGRSGLRVSELCLGAMTFGEEWGIGADQAESRKVFEAFVEAGGNFVDTADSYNGGTSERWLGELVAGRRSDFVLATKFGSATDPAVPTASGTSRKHLVEALDASLQRLGTDYVDLYWVHAWDDLTPVDELMQALHDVVRAGKALYVGICNTPAWWIARGQTLAELRGWSPFVGLQLEYSLLQRDAERELLPMADALGFGVCAWGPLAGGLLTGKYDAADPDGRRAALHAGERDERTRRILEATREVATALGASPAQVALAWLRGRSPRVTPILGARTAAQLADNLATLTLDLPEAHQARLDEASAIALGEPHDLLRSKAQRRRTRGHFTDRIDP